MNRLGFSLAVTVAGLAGPAVAGIINVDPGGSILAAIKSASDGDEIVLAPGTYNEVIDFMGKAITVRSSGGPEVTFIDGTGLAESVVKCINGEGPETVLDGIGWGDESDSFAMDTTDAFHIYCLDVDRSGLARVFVDGALALTRTEFIANGFIAFGDMTNGRGVDGHFQLASIKVTHKCPWDLNGDGVVNVLDLIELVMSFGPCEGCPADFDDDGFVNVLDLIALLLNFGPCPGTECVWDVNGDGIVDQLDVQAVINNLGPCEDPDNCPWDVNGDGVVNGQDVAAVATHFGPCPSGSEPASEVPSQAGDLGLDR